MFMNHKLSSIAYALISIIAFGYLMVIGSTIILPILYGILLAVILSPIEKKLRKFVKFQILSIGLSYVLILIPLILIVWIVSSQLSNIVDSLPAINTSLKEGVAKGMERIYNTFPILRENKSLFSIDNIQSFLDGPLDVLKIGLLTSSQGLFFLFLAVLYSVFFMYYGKSFRAFIIYQFEKSSRPEIRDTISQIKSTIQSYIGGLGIVVLILSILNSLGLWIIGVKFALFWGVLAGLLAVIPYIGTILGGLFPLLYSMATADYSWQPAAVAIYYFVIQQVEGNIITPKVVGKQVNLNPLVSIFALILFATLWGIGGVILSLPLMSIIRIIFEQFPETKAIAILMGSEIAEDAHKFKEMADG